MPYARAVGRDERGSAGVGADCIYCERDGTNVVGRRDDSRVVDRIEDRQGG